MTHMLGLVSVKGGVGASVTALRAARQARIAGAQIILVDVTGDMAVLTHNDSEADGLTDLLGSSALHDDAAAAVERHLVDLDVGMRLLPRGLGELDPTDRQAWGMIWDGLAGDDHHVVIDAGRGDAGFAVLDTVEDRHGELRQAMVLGCGFQDLVRARALDDVFEPEGIVVITDPQRCLGLSDIENSLERTADVVLAADRSVANAADSGQLLSLATRDGHQLDVLMDLQADTAPLAWIDR